MSDLFPPSIQKESEDPQMQQWAYEATSAIDAGKIAGQTCLERYREAGLALTKAKAKCTFGKWLTWLKSNGISKSSAYRALQAAKLPSSGNFDEEAKVFGEVGEEEEKPFETVDGIKFCSRDCRLQQGKKGCKKCAKLNKKPHEPKAPPPPYDGPKRLATVFEEVDLYTKAFRSARNLRKHLQSIERGVSYRATTRGMKAEHLSDKVVNIQSIVKNRPPAKPCPSCDLSPSSGETAWCDTCKGKGYLTVSEVELLDGDGLRKADEK